MATPNKRLGDLIKGLTPEEKARLLIEDRLRAEPYFSPAECAQMLAAMSPTDSHRYNSFLERYQNSVGNLKTLGLLTSRVEELLLNRDRMLWYYRGIKDVFQELVFRPASAPLLQDNLKLKPGTLLEIKTALVTLRIGACGRNRSPLPQNGDSVVFNESAAAALDECIDQIRREAAEAKAVFSHVIEESKAQGLEHAVGIAKGLIGRIASWDEPTTHNVLKQLEKRRAQWDNEGSAYDGRDRRVPEEQPSVRGQGVFPAPKRWELEWGEITEDADTARRIREDPVRWGPPSLEGLEKDGQLEHWKERAQQESGNLSL